MALADEKYVSFTTYKRDSGSTSVPVWIVGAGDGKLGFTTSSSSWKAKRLANDDRIQIQPSDARGRIKAGTTPQSGTAVVAKGTEFEAMTGRIKAKYGFPVVLIGAWAKLRKLLGTDTASDCAIVMTLDGPDES
jgi:PPOX class probable F420-dependent enzyme